MKKIIILFLLLMSNLCLAQVVQDLKNSALDLAESTKKAVVKVDQASTTKMLYKDSRNGVATVYADGKDGLGTVYADSKDVITTVYSDGKELLSAVGEDTKKALIYLGQKAGVAAEKVYEVYTKKFWVEGLVGVLKTLLLTIILITLVSFIYKRTKVIVVEKLSVPAMLVSFLVIVTIGSLTFTSWGELPTNINKLVNPEFYTIQTIFETVKTLVK